MTVQAKHLHLSYTATQLFDLVADVERYPEFLPWIVATRITHRKNRTVWVDMTIGTSFLRRQFATVALLERPHQISIDSRDPLFECFKQNWTFEPATGGGSNVAYEVDFQFRSRALQALIGGSFASRAAEMVTAFRHRARQLYGDPSSSDRVP